MWPDTIQSIEVFFHFRKQWRMGLRGPISLDYGALPAVLRFCEVTRKDWPAVFEDIRIMEIETLNLIAQENS